MVGFSSHDQRRMLDRLGLSALGEYGLTILMSAGAVTVMLAWWLSLARQPRQKDRVQRCWQRFCTRLARIGLAPQHHEGPLHYRRRILGQRPDLAAAVEEIVDAYLRLRYRPQHAYDDQRRFCSRVGRFRPRRRPPTSKVSAAPRQEPLSCRPPYTL